MIVIDNLPILADPYDILIRLKQELDERGIDLLNTIRTPANKNVQFTCPVHAGGKERKPSCGMRIEGKDAGTVHCFTCGYVATIQEFISYCFGHNDEGAYGKKWLRANFVSMAPSSRADIQLNIDRSPSRGSIQYVTEHELDSYRFYHDYMYKRKLTDPIIELFDVGYDKESNCLTFPVRDKKGNCLFVFRRSVATKFFQLPENISKPIYGLYELPDDAEEVYICESILNALTCWVYGKYAVALLGTGTEEQYNVLNKLPVRKYVIATDPDDAGRKAARKLKKNLKGKLVKTLQYPDGRDINDLNYAEFTSLLQTF